MKICFKCNTQHEDTNFRKKSASKDGLTPWCIPCLKTYEASKKESYSARKAAYHETNRAKENAQKKLYRETHRQQIRDKDKEYRTLNKEKEALRKATYKKLNPDKYSAYHAKRRSIKLRAIPLWADLKAIEKIYAERITMSEQSGIEYHVHHIIPLVSDLVCGLHCEANLTVITAEENLRLGNRIWPDMP